MQSRYLLSTLLLVCSAATSADNAGWQNARTPQTTNSASDHVQNASQNTGGVPATLVKGELPAPGQASPLVQDAARLDSELSADEIRSLRSLMADNERAINAPITSVVPRISSLTVNLSPGASLPLVRTAMNNLSVVTFTDINGSPWPQSDPPYNAAPKLFDVQYNENMVTITPLRPWAPDLHPSTVVALNRRSLQEVFSNDKFRVRRGREALSALMQNRLAVEDKFRSFRPADFADVFRRYPPSGRSPLREKMNGIALILTPDSFIKKEYVD
ncbi:DotH/IcmK family type IV secretion protein [Escherichia coli]|uniref:DotH/IcmK family type IV secretion protein n=1 Tax=Escherichia coli TaxID=562 RepID=UPI0039047EAF